MDAEALDQAIAACEREPIQIPGAVQAHGVLFALRAVDFTILQVSDNCYEILGIHTDELLHQPLSRMMDIAPVELASHKIGERTPRLLNPIPIEISAHGKLEKFDGILHRSGRILILELERHVAENKGYGGFGGFYEAIRDVSTKIMLSDSLDDVLRLTCDEIRKLTSFSRVLIYKFDDDWNGTVIAESKTDEEASLLHHRFPASDIPKQARDLYTTNWLRLIPNVDYTPAKLIPVNNPITDRPLDLSNSVLRSVSPVHLEYMKNMGQAASMSISLLKGRKLWGLISCHHRQERYLKYDTRVAAEFIGQMVSSQIVAREDSAEVDHRLQLKGIYDQLLRKGGGYADVAYVLGANASLFLSLTDSQGAALLFGGEVRLMGRTPTREQIRELCHWLSRRGESVFQTHHLLELYPACADYVQLSAGILAVQVPNLPGGIIIWFRPELTDKIPWGGNPNEAKITSTDGKLHPRKSLETWYENVAGMSAKWKPSEIEAAGELRLVLMGMADKHTFSGGGTDQRSDFRTSLADSIAAANATPARSFAAEDGASTLSAQNFSMTESSRALLEGFSEMAILFLDTEGKIRNWSAGAARLLGYVASQVLGQRLELFLSENSASKGLGSEMVEKAYLENRNETELWLYRADQTSFWGKVIITAVKSELKLHIGFSVVVQNVTKEKAAEEELKSTKLAAEAANNAKSVFLANISHEIRTPLGAVLGFAELLGMENQSPVERADLSARIARNGAQLTTLINDLLDISKVESGRLEVESLEFPLPDLLTDVHQTLNFKASEKSILFEVGINGELPLYVVSDPTRLRQILINLVGNAIKFTAQGGQVTLTCSLEPSPSGTRLAFRVKDSGRGMTEVEMSRLFQPFTQADVSTTREYGGSGLGLFVSQRLARSLGGDLTIEHSKPGSGSTFLATVEVGKPKRNEVFAKLEKARPTEKLSQINNKELAGVRVLVIDDSPDNRQLLNFFLSKSGAIVETANDGKQGSEKALAEDFDIVLLDVQMPVMDGNTAMLILADKGYRKPVIALTAHAMASEREHSLSLGFSEYLTKPIDREHLIKTIRELIS
jgi:PAS domain S-box-containing protein